MKYNLMPAKNRPQINKETKLQQYTCLRSVARLQLLAYEGQTQHAIIARILLSLQRGFELLRMGKELEAKQYLQLARDDIQFSSLQYALGKKVVYKRRPAIDIIPIFKQLEIACYNFTIFFAERRLEQLVKAQVAFQASLRMIMKKPALAH